MRGYVRSGVSGWSVERQREALREAGVPDRAVYADELSPAKASKRDPALLARRAELLRPTARQQGDVVVIATLRAFAVSERDFLSSVGALFARRDGLLVLDTGKRLDPPPGAAEVVAEVAKWAADIAADIRQAQTAIARKRALETARKKMDAGERAKRARIEADWRATDDAGRWAYSAAVIAERHNVSARSLYNWFGKRPARPRRQETESDE